MIAYAKLLPMFTFSICLKRKVVELAQGLAMQVTAEVAPQAFLSKTEALTQGSNAAKEMNPPLRLESDRRRYRRLPSQVLSQLSPLTTRLVPCR